MIFSEGEDKKGKFYKASLISRLAQTLENYTNSEFGALFYSEEYLKGICEQREKAIARHSKAGAGLYLLTLFLAFFDNVGGLSIYGVNITLPEISKLSLSIFVSASVLGWVLVAIDQITIERLIKAIGEKSGIRQFELVLLNYSARNLINISIMPKYTGLESEWGHKRFAYIIAILFIIILACLYLAPVLVVIQSLVMMYPSLTGFFEYALALISIILLITSLFIIVIHAINFKFRPAQISEPDFGRIYDNISELGSPALRRNANLSDPIQSDNTESH